MTIRIPLYHFPSEAGKKWRPANGVEGDYLRHACSYCVNDAPDASPPIYCDVLGRSLSCQTSDPDYPQELCYDAEGYPQCTAFRGTEEYQRAQMAKATPELPFEGGHQ